MHDHVTRILEALERFAKANIQPAVDEPANDFERAVNEWRELQLLQSEIKDLMKPLNNDERAARDGLANSLRGYFGENLKEGVNTYSLSNGRKLKFTHKLDRKIESSMIPVARQAYNALGGEVEFDELLRVKYELAAAPYRKVEKNPELTNAVSRMLVTKPAAPVMEVD